jgi:hypothetical protein
VLVPFFDEMMVVQRLLGALARSNERIWFWCASARGHIPLPQG